MSTKKESKQRKKKEKHLHTGYWNGTFGRGSFRTSQWQYDS